MSMRYQAAILTASYFPLKVPDAPTVGTATAGNAQVSLTFTAPSNVGAGAITSYIAVVTDSSSGAVFTNTGASSPIVVTGLTNGNNYTAKVAATNAFGTGPNSASSSSFSPANNGQQAYTTAGTYSWVAPTGVTSVSVVCVGGSVGRAGSSSGRGGGGLGWKNNISVTPGNTYTVVAGGQGQTSYFINTGTVNGGGATGRGGGSFTGDGGGNGGLGNQGGGGAGGYTGNGGAGGDGGGAGSAGSGGGGGGGAGYDNVEGCGGGGGVGILGQGTSGAGGTGTNGGGGGSGGGGGANVASNGRGGDYGGGAGGNDSSNTGGGGAVRIIWPGTSRSFPSTNTGDL